MVESSESDTAPERDLALVNALQPSPRAEWSELGHALGVTSATAARRWRALRDRGAAWIGVTVGHRRGQEIASAFVLVECRGDPSGVADRLGREAEVATIARTMGRYDLLLDVLVTDLEALRRYVGERLPEIEGVATAATFPISTIFTEGSRWRVGALDADQVRHLGGGAHPAGRVAQSASVDNLDRLLIQTLASDGRIGWAELADACDTTATTARRRVQRLLQDGSIELRCELATPLAGPAVQVTFLIRLPAASIPEIGAMLAAAPKCRLAAAVVDRTNLVATMWFASAAEITPFERSLVARWPQLDVEERVVHIGTVKRIGHLLDPQSRTTGVVPLAAW